MCFKLAPFFCFADCENVCSHYHHQIGNMNFFALGVWSWNNGMRCMSCSVLIVILLSSDKNRDRVTSNILPVKAFLSFTCGCRVWKARVGRCHPFFVGFYSPRFYFKFPMLSFSDGGRIVFRLWSPHSGALPVESQRSHVARGLLTMLPVSRGLRTSKQLFCEGG